MSTFDEIPPLFISTKRGVCKNKAKILDFNKHSHYPVVNRMREFAEHRLNHSKTVDVMAGGGRFSILAEMIGSSMIVSSATLFRRVFAGDQYVTVKFKKFDMGRVHLLCQGNEFMLVACPVKNVSIIYYNGNFSVVSTRTANRILTPSKDLPSVLPKLSDNFMEMKFNIYRTRI